MIKDVFKIKMRIIIKIIINDHIDEDNNGEFSDDNVDENYKV